MVGGNTRVGAVGGMMGVKGMSLVRARSVDTKPRCCHLVI